MIAAADERPVGTVQFPHLPIIIGQKRKCKRKGVFLWLKIACLGGKRTKTQKNSGYLAVPGVCLLLWSHSLISSFDSFSDCTVEFHGVHVLTGYIEIERGAELTSTLVSKPLIQTVEVLVDSGQAYLVHWCHAS